MYNTDHLVGNGHHFAIGSGAKRGVKWGRTRKNLVFFLLETLKTPLSFKKMSTWRANRPPLTPSLKKINFEPPPPLLLNHILHILMYSFYSTISFIHFCIPHIPWIPVIVNHYYFPSLLYQLCFTCNRVSHSCLKSQYYTYIDLKKDWK